MDHFARPADELAIAQRNRTLHRNFQGYTTKAGADLYGMGVSAISSIGGPPRKIAAKFPRTKRPSPSAAWPPCAATAARRMTSRREVIGRRSATG